MGLLHAYTTRGHQIDTANNNSEISDQMRIKTCFNTLVASAAATLIILTPAQAVPVSGQGTWETTLQARDLDGNGITDAYYDTDLNITWLRDANVNGRKAWTDQNNWAEGYSIGGYSDWRLPTTMQPDPSCQYQALQGTYSYGYNCTGSEMGHLWYTELGNTAGVPMTNTGDFQNLLSNLYWSGTESARDSDKHWRFFTDRGFQDGTGPLTDFLYAMAVRDGDVPEPQSLALVLTALGAVALLRRRRATSISAL